MSRRPKSARASRLGITNTWYLVLLVVLIRVGIGAQPLGMDSVQVTTFFDTQAPPGEGAPVYLQNVVGPVGKIQNVRLVPEHSQYHDRWEVVMGLNPQEVSRVRTDSVVYLKMPDPNQNHNGRSKAPYLEIDAEENLGQFITNHAVLRGQVTYFAEIGWMLPRVPWWRKVTIRPFCLPVIVIIAVFFVFVRFRARNQSKNTG
jgi:hypothetical protein